MSKELFQLQIDEARKHAEAQARQLAEFMQPMTDHAMYEVFNAQFHLLNQAIENLGAIILADDEEGVKTTENPHQSLITEAYAFNTTAFIAEHPLVEAETAVDNPTADLNQEHVEPPKDLDVKADDQTSQPAPTTGGNFMSRIFNSYAPAHKEEKSKVSADDAITTEHPVPAPIVTEQNIGGRSSGGFFSSMFSCGGCSSSAVDNNAHAPQTLKQGHDEESKVSGDDAVATEHPAQVVEQIAGDGRTIMDSIIGGRQLPPVLTPQPVNTTFALHAQQQVDQYGFSLLEQPQGQSSLSAAEIGSGITSTDSVVLKLFGDNNDHVM